MVAQTFGRRQDREWRSSTGGEDGFDEGLTRMGIDEDDIVRQGEDAYEYGFVDLATTAWRKAIRARRTVRS